MVKLQRRFAYKYKDREHFKHVVTIPEDYVDKLGWKEGDNLAFSVTNHRLTLAKSQKENE